MQPPKHGIPTHFIKFAAKLFKLMLRYNLKLNICTVILTLNYVSKLIAATNAQRKLKLLGGKYF